MTIYNVPVEWNYAMVAAVSSSLAWNPRKTMFISVTILLITNYTQQAFWCDLLEMYNGLLDS